MVRSCVCLARWDATATKGVRQPASARTPTSDVAVMSSSQSERAVKTLSEPGLPGLGARALCICMTVVPVMDQLDRLVMDRLLKNTGHVDRSR